MFEPARRRSTSSPRPTAPSRAGWVGADRRARRASPRPTWCARSARSPGCWRTTASPTPRARPRRSRSPTTRAEQPADAAAGRAAALAARPAAADPGRPGVVGARGRRGAAGRAAGRDPGRPVRRPAAAGPAGHLPAAAVLDHDEYLRPLVGTEALASQRLFMIAADLGRDADGQWKVISDRTQAPSGAGYAMQNRRVVSRVLPEIYHAGPPAPADPVLPGHAAGAGRRRAAARSRTRGSSCSARAPTPRPRSTRPSSPRCSASRCWRAATSPSATAGSGCGCSASSSRST